MYYEKKKKNNTKQKFEKRYSQNKKIIIQIAFRYLQIIYLKYILLFDII